MSNTCCSFHDLPVSRFIYLGVRPESEGILHSFKIKLTGGKNLPFSPARGRTGKALCRCSGCTLTHIVTGRMQTSRRLNTPYFPLIETWSVAARLRFTGQPGNAKQCCSGFPRGLRLLYQLCWKPSPDLNDRNKTKKKTNGRDKKTRAYNTARAEWKRCTNRGVIILVFCFIRGEPVPR